VSRPVHYAAHGARSLAFRCFSEEEAAWENSMVPDGDPPIPGWPAPLRAQKPRPRRSTDLNKVTCLACWRAISRMAEEARQRLAGEELARRPVRRKAREARCPD
jgi:hypothetical protein